MLYGEEYRWSDEEYYDMKAELGQERDAAIARAEAAEAMVKELESRLAAMQWRPIAEYDAMAEKPIRSLFGFTAKDGQDYCSCMQSSLDTHFLQLPPVPGEEPTR